MTTVTSNTLKISVTHLWSYLWVGFPPKYKYVDVYIIKTSFLFIQSSSATQSVHVCTPWSLQKYPPRVQVLLVGSLMFANKDWYWISLSEKASSIYTDCTWLNQYGRMIRHRKLWSVTVWRSVCFRFHLRLTAHSGIIWITWQKKDSSSFTQQPATDINYI